MKITDIPSKFSIPFADSAGPGYIRTIPTIPTGTAGQASLELGFPPENFNPVSAGGVPPFGQDFNGILNQSTAWNRWASAGNFPPYDATWQAAVGGYPRGSCVASLVQFGLVWLSTVDDNVTNPDTGGAGWFRYIQIITSNTDLYVNASTGNDNNDGFSPATALATIQGAINRAFSYPPSQFTITIHVADGSYSAFSVPHYGGPNIIIIGNETTPANVQVNGGTAAALAISGPNTLTIRGLKLFTGTTNPVSPIVSVGSASTLTMINNETGVGNGAAIEAFGGSINVGNHRFSGNVAGAFFSYNGIIGLLPSAVFTIVGSITVSAFASSTVSGSLTVSAASAPTFVNAAGVTGPKYLANLNGVINVSGLGTSYFPGSTAGSVSSGGQYL